MQRNENENSVLPRRILRVNTDERKSINTPPFREGFRNYINDSLPKRIDNNNNTAFIPSSDFNNNTIRSRDEPRDNNSSIRSRDSNSTIRSRDETRDSNSSIRSRDETRDNSDNKFVNEIRKIDSEKEECKSKIYDNKNRKEDEERINRSNLSNEEKMKKIDEVKTLYKERKEETEQNKEKIKQLNQKELNIVIGLDEEDKERNIENKKAAREALSRTKLNDTKALNESMINLGKINEKLVSENDVDPLLKKFSKFKSSIIKPVEISDDNDEVYTSEDDDDDNINVDSIIKSNTNANLFNLKNNTTTDEKSKLSVNITASSPLSRNVVVEEDVKSPNTINTSNKPEIKSIETVEPEIETVETVEVDGLNLGKEKIRVYYNREKPKNIDTSFVKEGYKLCVGYLGKYWFCENQEQKIQTCFYKGSNSCSTCVKYSTKLRHYLKEIKDKPTNSQLTDGEIIDSLKCKIKVIVKPQIQQESKNETQEKQEIKPQEKQESKPEIQQYKQEIKPQEKQEENDIKPQIQQVQPQVQKQVQQESKPEIQQVQPQEEQEKPEIKPKIQPKKHTIYSNIPLHESILTYEDLIEVYGEDYERLSYDLFQKNEFFIQTLNRLNQLVIDKNQEIIILNSKLDLIKSIL